MTGVNIPPRPFYNSAGRVVGRLSADGYLEKRGIDYRKHHLHKYHGWATDTDHVTKMAEHAAFGMRLFLTDGRVLTSSLTDWLQHGYTSPALEGDQTVLRDCYWRDSSSSPANPLPTSDPPVLSHRQLQIAMAL